MKSGLKERSLNYLKQSHCVNLTMIKSCGGFRMVKANGELNAKFPGGIEAQKRLLEEEGHTVIERGRTNIRYFVKNYEQALFVLE